MYLSINQMSGKIPAAMASMTKLQKISVGTNALSGKPPGVMAFMTSLEYMDFSANRLSGNVPDAMPSMMSLEYMDFSANRLSGNIPAVSCSGTSPTAVPPPHPPRGRGSESRMEVSRAPAWLICNRQLPLKEARRAGRRLALSAKQRSNFNTVRWAEGILSAAHPCLSGAKGYLQSTPIVYAPGSWMSTLMVAWTLFLGLMGQRKGTSPIKLKRQPPQVSTHQWGGCGPDLNTLDLEPDTKLTADLEEDIKAYVSEAKWKRARNGKMVRSVMRVPWVTEEPDDIEELIKNDPEPERMRRMVRARQALHSFFVANEYQSDYQDGAVVGVAYMLGWATFDGHGNA